MDKEKKEKIAIALGAILILAVAVTTILRSLEEDSDNVNISDVDEKIAPQSAFRTISSKDLKAEMSTNKKLSLIDVRDEESFLVQHIIDSVSYQSDDELSLAAVPRENKIVIIGADSEDASTESIAKSFMDKGYRDIAILAGGIAAWTNQNFQSVSIGDPTSMSDQAKVSYISTDDLKNKLSDKSLFILDISSTADFTQGHLEGAINIPFEELEGRRKELPNTKNIVVCGQNEMQEFQAAVQIYDMILTPSYVLKGSLTKWKEQGYPTVK